MSFEEMTRCDGRFRSPAWRRLAAPVSTQCYVAQTRMTLPVTDVNDETRAVRVAYDTVEHGTVHIILEPWAYRDAGGLFAPAGDTVIHEVPLDPVLH